MNNINLGLLDFGEYHLRPDNIVSSTIDYAVKADELGFTRFWLGEHYLTSTYWYNPDVIIPILVGMTTNMNIGVAGLLMAYHNPYRVALFYKMLSGLFPDRVDLGIAKGRVREEILEHLAPQFVGAGDQYIYDQREKNISDLLKYMNMGPEVASLPLLPHDATKPNMWALTTGTNSLEKMIDQQLNYSRSLFHTPINGRNLSEDREKIEEFKERYYNKHGVHPLLNISISGICCKESQQATSSWEKIKSTVLHENPVLGSPEYFLEMCSYYTEQLGIDEVIFLNMGTTLNEKYTGIELLADKFELMGRTVSRGIM